LAAQPPVLRHLTLDHESFAVSYPLALPGTAFYPVLVHERVASLHDSSPHSFTLTHLHFTFLTATKSQRALHPQVCGHAGRTKKKPPDIAVEGFEVRLLSCFARCSVLPEDNTLTYYYLTAIR
jgi:hypothetical protein